MMDATGRWLAPMMAAADEHGIDVQALMTQATTVTMLSRPRAWWRPLSRWRRTEAVTRLAAVWSVAARSTRLG
jgi:hypothetical protein